MELDPDIAIPSIETNGLGHGVARGSKTPHGERFRSDSVSTTTTSTSQYAQRLDSSSMASSFRTPRSRPSTPGGSNVRSPSVSSLRNERTPTPKLDRKRSTPNLSLRSATPIHQPQFRRASSNLNPATPLRLKSTERPSMTPASVAKEYFQRELQSHTRNGSKVVVYTHEACYGHRFSRPRSSKATLASIVERPERIHATLLGTSTAYIRLGQRHKDGPNAPHPDRAAVAPPFALIKSSRSIPLNHPAVTAVHGAKWMDSLQIMCDSAEAKLAMGQKELARPVGHTRDPHGNALPPLHSGDLYLCSESLNAMQGCLGGVCDAVDTVFQPDGATRRAFVCIRPPGHHCSADMPSGFCWLNNVHVGISYAAMNHGLTHAAIIDFDLHHGDGSQTITWDHNRNAHNAMNSKSLPSHKKTPIGYYSLHDINSYPCEYGDDEKVRNASICLHNVHGQAIWNVHLEPWDSHADFWRLYEAKYKVLLEKAFSFLQFHSNLLRQAGIPPKAAVFLSSGFDASEWESAGMQRHQVNVPTDFYARITEDVLKIANHHDTGVDERVISVLEGGYSDRALTSGVLSHLCGLTKDVPRETTQEAQHGLAGPIAQEDSSFTPDYDPEWWHVSNLELLEAMVDGHLPKPAAKSKDKSASSYSSPTQASTAKMAEVTKERKSLSAYMEARLLLENAPPEPVPEVDWITASYELSRLLIPSDRQTKSCTHEELNAENSRARRDRLSLTHLPTSDGIEEKMQLRDRKAKVATSSAAPPGPSSRTANRRTTIAAASDLPDPSMRERSRSRRRSSAGSSIVSVLHDLRLDDKPERPMSRGPSRAGSVQPSKPEAALPVKKTRAPIRKPAASAAATSPRKTKSTAASNNRLGTVKETEATDTTAAESVTPSSTEGMDELTSGMKKISIKLKMPTEEQHNANRQRMQEATAPTTTAMSRAKTARKPAVPKASNIKSTSTTEAEIGKGPTSKPFSKVSTPANEESGMAQANSVSAAGDVDAPKNTDPAGQEHQQAPVQPKPATTTSVPDSLSAAAVLQPPSGVAYDATNGLPNPEARICNKEPAEGEVVYPSIYLKRESTSPLMETSQS